jgi:hypothetical protein
VCRSSASFNSTFHEHTTSVIGLRPERLASCSRSDDLFVRTLRCVSAASYGRFDQSNHPCEGWWQRRHRAYAAPGTWPSPPPRRPLVVVDLPPQEAVRTSHVASRCSRPFGRTDGATVRCPSSRDLLAKRARPKPNVPKGCPPSHVAKRDPGSATRDAFLRRSSFTGALPRGSRMSF